MSIKEEMADKLAKEAVRHSHNSFHQEKYFMSCYWCIYESCLDSKDELAQQLVAEMDKG